MKKRFLLASFLIHGLLLTSILAVPARGGRRGPKPPALSEKERIVYTALVKQAMKAKPIPVAAKGPIAIQKKKKKETAKVAKVDKKPVAPTPTPPPSAPDEKEKLSILKKYYPNLSDQEIKDFKLPPGVKDWKEFDSITALLDQQNWLGVPPELASGSAQASGSVGILDALADLLAPFDQQEGLDSSIQKRGDTTVMVCQYGDMMFVAQWKEGEALARVNYFAHGKSLDPAKSFTIPVDASTNLDDLKVNMQAQVILGYQSAGSPR